MNYIFNLFSEKRDFLRICERRECVYDFTSPETQATTKCRITHSFIFNFFDLWLINFFKNRQNCLHKI